LGNSIPKYEPGSYFSYQLEYLLKKQKIKNIIILGHTQCHFLEEELKKDEQLHNHPSSLIDTMKQLDLYEKQPDRSTSLRILIQENVLCQIKHLLTYPLILDSIEKNQLHLQGWVYKVEANQWYFFDNEKDQLVSFSSSDDLMQPKLQNFKTM
jgi:carbonic anhydrase